uniref:Uncharacterized protein n=1 Tax=Nelumbo nucifera TaxID=4432 RepID=A0A822ZH62_NELNU|nr:TPA_asm: hypothetical protein HUJ06_003664 [Nelumbo nucifera]
MPAISKRDRMSTDPSELFCLNSNSTGSKIDY